MVQALATGRSAISLEKGTILFHQGDPAVAFFIVLSGWMKLYRTGVDGSEIVIHVAKAGETFAEAAMFLGGAYPVNAAAVTDVRLHRIEGRAVRDGITANPNLAFALLGAMSRRLRYLVGEIEALKRRGATEMVAEFLMELSASSASDQARVTLPFEKTLIAALLGIKPESLSRALGRLKSAGVEVNGAEVSIASRKALAQAGALRLQDSTPGTLLNPAIDRSA